MTTTGKVTTRQVREEAKRVFGDELVEVGEDFFAYPGKFVVVLKRSRALACDARSRAAARRFALEMLRRMSSRDGGG